MSNRDLLPTRDFPSDWSLVAVFQAASQESGSTVIGPFGSDLTAGDYRSSGVPVVFVRDIRVGHLEWISNTWISHQKARALSAHAAVPGDVVATKMGLPPGISAVYPRDMPAGIVTADVIRVRPDIRIICPEWLSLAINSYRAQRQVAAITGGVTRPKITLGDFRRVLVPVPPLHEQKRVVEILDSVDESIRSTERATAKLRETRSAILSSLVRAPDWTARPLGNMCKVSSGSTPDRSVPAYWRRGYIPWIKTGEICNSTINECEERVTRAAVRAAGLRLYPAGTVLVAMYGQGATRGRVGILEMSATINQACAALECDPTLMRPEFLYLYLSQSYGDLRRLGHGSQQTNLNAEILSRFEVGVPSLIEQDRVVRHIAHWDDRVSTETSTLKKLISVREGLMEDLLTGRVRVKVGEDQEA